MSKRLHTALRGIGSVLAIAPGPGVAGFRERVRRVRLYRDDREALRSDFERVAADLRKVLDRIGNADH
ncbi:hypothetical protein [Plasticicumulans sp.]|uniref:hypothetical protein n=1 Tax=Plasticicumulans sp. TaxID=2307179 RepID=UPI002B5B3023|nr:hypothetical protein [Plasticicumulans sp.]MBS0601307.1 hypothetical protein [Pseudomonadota bacterium]HMV39448.1 hypothetical protein [Plasticicumulans sp.]HMW29076.1 hypothetical protein [Plasticicumulans sp.]HMW42853.1 hypothetical protein [Plasticicumulans sp.]HMX54676.1 hypothetical protein [Plasticicumulans sp.]